VTFESAMEAVVVAFEVAGIAILAIGSLRALVTAGASLARGERKGVYERARVQVGQAILLGLEVLIIADIVQTVTIDASIESAATLGIIVLVRTFLSFSLEIELEGVVPWHRRRARQLDPGAGGATALD
jgi:uncharacterized membrane protein